MTEEEKIKYIASHTDLNTREMAPVLGMRPSAVAEFVSKHKAEIAEAIQTEEGAEEEYKEPEMPEGLTQTRLGADVTRMCELCEAFSRYARENLYPPVEWVDEIAERATDVARGLREEMNMRDA